MARRSLVVQPPPRRQAVVLRAGGPQRRAGAADWATLVAGVLLLLAAVWLVSALPDKDVLTPQYRASFPDAEPVEHPSQSAAVPEGDEAAFPFDVASPNTYAIQITVNLQDDAPTTLPDTFEVTLEAPNGTIHEGGSITTERPRFNSTTGAFESPGLEFQFLFNVIPHPQDRIFEAAAPNETLEEATARVAPAYVVDNRGEWTVRLYLRQAGDCPDPDADPSLLLQSAMCLQQHPNGQDQGNPITLAKVRATAYMVAISDLEA